MKDEIILLYLFLWPYMREEIRCSEDIKRNVGIGSLINAKVDL